VQVLIEGDHVQTRRRALVHTLATPVVLTQEAYQGVEQDRRAFVEMSDWTGCWDMLATRPAVGNESIAGGRPVDVAELKAGGR
jgi:hypothetical protein